MNWKRVAIFIVLLLLGTACAAFPVGVIHGILMRANGQVPRWVPVVQAFAVQGAILLVGGGLGFVQRERLVLHGLAVGVGSWLVSFPINVLLFKQPLVTWAAGIIGIIVFLGVGCALGFGVRQIRTTSRTP